MSLPPLTKTWLHSTNNVIATGQNFSGYGELSFTWKTFMTTGLVAWTVVASSDAATADLTDRWINAAACNTHDNPGQPHSWIVLQNDAIATGFQICLDLDENSGGSDTIFDMYVSEAIGFTGGTTTNRPTAADEVTVASSIGRHQWCETDLTVDPAILHMQRSSDGEIWRWWIFVNGVLRGLTSIEKPAAAQPGWTIPWVTVAPWDWYASTAYNPSYGHLNDSKIHTASRADGAGRTTLYVTSEGFGTEMLGQNQTNGADLDSGAFPFFPMGLYSDVVPRGRLGTLTDMWWGSTFPASGDHYPADISRQFVQVGDVIVPWPGGAAMQIT